MIKQRKLGGLYFGQYTPDDYPHLREYLTLYKYITREALEGFLDYSDFKLSYPSDANDPLELLTAEEEPQRDIESEVGFISLTKKENSPPMWGNYAGKYSGACVAFKVPYYKQQYDKAPCEESVDYQCGYTRAVLKRAGIEVYYFRTRVYNAHPEVRAAFQVGDAIYKCVYKKAKPQQYLSEDHWMTHVDSDDKMLSIHKRWERFFTKKPEWSYEDEYRILISHADCSDVRIINGCRMKFSNDLTPYVTQIILGAYCEVSYKDVIKRLKSSTTLPRIRNKIQIRKSQFDKKVGDFIYPAAIAII